MVVVLTLCSGSVESLWKGITQAACLCILNWRRALLLAAVKGGIVVLFLMIPNVFFVLLPILLLAGASLSTYFTCVVAIPPSMRQTVLSKKGVDATA